MFASFRKTQNKMLYLQRAIEHSETKEQSVQDYLANTIRVVGISLKLKSVQDYLANIIRVVGINLNLNSQSKII